MPDEDEKLHLGAGHIYKLPGFVENAPPVLKELIKNDPSVAQYMESISVHMGNNETK